MTEPAGPGIAPPLPHGRRPLLRVVGGTDVVPLDAQEQAQARAAAARAAHPSSGAPGSRGPQPVAALPPPPAAREVCPAEQEARAGGTRILEGPGPHVVTGRAFLAAARPGDVLRVEVLGLAGGSAPLERGCTAYLPVGTQGTVFCPRELCRALGAAGQPRRGSFRLEVRGPGAQDVPSVAHRRPFAETDEHWIVVGHSATAEPAGAGSGDERPFCTTTAVHRAVRAGVEFLEQERGMDRPIAQAYLSATVGFAATRLGDGSVGAHGRIRKADFR